MDDIEALPMDDEQKEEIQEEAEDVDSSEVDSDAAEALESREYTSLLDRKKVAAAAKPKTKTAAKGSKTTSAGRRTPTSKRSAPSTHEYEVSAASSPLPPPVPQPPTGKYRRITGKRGAGKDNKQDDGDTQIGFVDGRAENLRPRN